MSKWIKFTDRLPTEADANIKGQVLILYPDGGMASVDRLMQRNRMNKENNCCWLEDVPEPPKPRTLEDVVREYIETVINHRHYTDERAERGNRLVEEMRGILEKGDDNG